MSKNSSVLVSSKRAEGSLFSLSAISSHLRTLKFPETSILSMNRCGEPLGYYYSWCDCGHCDSKSVMRYHCNLRTCSNCSRKRQNKIVRKYRNGLSKLPKTRLFNLYFLTISPENYSDLKFGLSDIRKKFSNFLRLKYVKERIEGSIYVIEVTESWNGKEHFDDDGNLFYVSKTKSWNLHIHAIVYGRRLDNTIRGRCLDCNQNYIKCDHISKKHYCASRKCNSLNVEVFRDGDSKIVSLWKKNNNQDVNMRVTTQDTSFGTLRYMLKYVNIQPTEFQNELSIARYIVATSRTRLISTTGCFNGKKGKRIFGDVSRRKCPICKSNISIISCFEIDKRVRDVELLNLLSSFSAPPPPPKPLNLDDYVF